MRADTVEKCNFPAVPAGPRPCLLSACKYTYQAVCEPEQSSQSGLPQTRRRTEVANAARTVANRAHRDVRKTRQNACQLRLRGAVARPILDHSDGAMDGATVESPASARAGTSACAINRLSVHGHKIDHGQALRFRRGRKSISDTLRVHALTSGARLGPNTMKMS